MGDTATVEPTDLDLDFDALFASAEAAAEVVTDEVSPVEPEAAADDTPEQPEPEKDVTPAKEPAEPEAKSPEPAKEPEQKAEPEPVKEKPEDIQAAISAEVERRLKEAKDKEAADKAAADADAARAASEGYTAEEQELMAAIANDFAADSPKVFAAIERVAVAKATNLFDKKLAELEARLTTQISPLQQNIAVTTQDAFDRELKAAHSDAYELMPKIEEWVSTQPTYLQTAYNAVLDGKTDNPLQDTISLIAMVKESLGMNKPAAPEQPPVTPEKEEKIAQQEGIRSRSSQSVLGGTDDTDDEALFERFATNRKA